MIEKLRGKLFLSRIYLMIEENKRRKELNKYRPVWKIETRILYILSNIFRTLPVSNVLSRCLFKDRTKNRVNRIRFFFPDFLNRCHEFARKSNDRFTKESKNGTLRATRHVCYMCTYVCVYACVCVCMTFVIDANCKHEWQICIFRINMTKFLLDRLYVNQRFFFRYWTRISRHRFLCTRFKEYKSKIF